MFPIKLNCLLCVLFVASGAAYCEVHWESPLLGYVEFPPLTFENEKMADGSVITAARETFSAMSLYPRYQSLPPARLFQQLERGEIDGWFGIRVPSIAPQLMFSARPIASIRLGLFRLNTIPDQALSAIKPDEAVVLIHGWSYGGLRMELEKTHTVYDAPNNHSAIKMLALGRADYLLSYHEVVETIPDRPDNLESRTLDTIRIYFQLRKDFPDAKEIMQAFDRVNIR